MNCTTARKRLFAYLDGGLRDDERADVERHLADCAACAELATALATPADEPEWVRGVLERTSGSACASSEPRLPDWVDGALGPIDDALVAEHAAHCRGCSAQAAALRALSADLPALAEATPDAAFLGEVLAATSRRALAPTLPQRIRQRLAALLQRPRIAWEFAYVATVFLIVVCVVPGSPLAAVPAKALDVARSGGPDAFERPFVALDAGMDSTGRAAGSWMKRMTVESAVAFDDAKRDVGTIWTRIASPQTNDRRNQANETRGNGDEK